jgi:hypothetical protein
MFGRLTFKKAFGIDLLRAEDTLWLLELRDAVFRVEVNGARVVISQGRFGVTTREKMAIAGFRYADQRDPRSIGEIPTLDIVMEVDVSLTDDFAGRSGEISVANELVDRFSERAFKALRLFIDGYRDLKYTGGRSSAGWRSNQELLIPRMTRNEFRTYLFYVLDVGGNEFVGVFSEGRMFGGPIFNSEMHQRLQSVLERAIPLERILGVAAWEYFYEDDFRSAIVHAASAIERVMTNIARRRLTERAVASSSQIDKFIDETSNRLICTVVLGQLGIGDEAFRNELAEIFEVRNGLIHGKRYEATRAEAEAALDRMERLFDVVGTG